MKNRRTANSGTNPSETSQDIRHMAVKGMICSGKMGLYTIFLTFQEDQYNSAVRRRPVSSPKFDRYPKAEAFKKIPSIV